MRDLNNEASKRCRRKRKQKMEEVLEEEKILIEKNAELKKRCMHMEDLVAQLKKKFIENISNPKIKGNSLENIILETIGPVDNHSF